MGCQHSVPVPTAVDFYHLPTSTVLGMHENVLSPITNPGMCYSFSIQNDKSRDTKQRDRKSVPGQAPKRELIDKKDGKLLANGLHVEGPTENGKLMLRDAHKNIIAVMKPKRHSGYDLYYEISCPRSPYNIREPSHHKAISFAPLSPAEERDDWYLWATVHSVPHQLEYEMRLTAKSEVYTQTYCGPMFGPCRMRIDNRQEQKTLALIEQTIEAWDVVIGPGVDPCLIICFTAIVNGMRKPRA